MNEKCQQDSEVISEHVANEKMKYESNSAPPSIGYDYSSEYRKMMGRQSDDDRLSDEEIDKLRRRESKKKTTRKKKSNACSLPDLPSCKLTSGADSDLQTGKKITTRNNSELSLISLPRLHGEMVSDGDSPYTSRSSHRLDEDSPTTSRISQQSDGHETYRIRLGLVLPTIVNSNYQSNTATTPRIHLRNNAVFSSNEKSNSNAQSGTGSDRNGEVKHRRNARKPLTDIAESYAKCDDINNSEKNEFKLPKI